METSGSGDDHDLSRRGMRKLPRDNTDIGVQREGGIEGLKKRRKAKFKYLCEEKITSH